MKKPRVLFLTDFENWPFHNKAKIIARYLSDRYEFELVNILLPDRSKNPRFMEIKSDEDYDLIFIFPWNAYPRVFNESRIHLKKNRVATTVASHWSLQLHKPDVIASILKKYRAVTCIDLRLVEIVRQYHPKVFYAPNGVDHQLFAFEPIEKGSPMVVGWAGSKYEHGDKKGFDEFILPATRNLKGVELKVVSYENDNLPHAEMPKFYHSIHCYLCASRTEGGPNPNLEAASCGRVLVTPRVGNMPEFIKDGENGIFVERDVASIRNTLVFVRDHPELWAGMGEKARIEIEKNWTWEKNAGNYAKLFEQVLDEDP